MTKLTREKGSALWRRIADELRADVARNRLRPGDRLANEAVLADRFGVNRHTLRQAISELAHEGVLRVEHGRGTFVQTRAIDYPLKARTRFSEIVVAAGLEPSHEVLSTLTRRATAEEADALKLGKRALVAVAEMAGHASRRAIVVGEHVFPGGRLPGILELLRKTQSISAAFAALGHKDYRRGETRITAELPTPTLAEKLGISASRPVLKTETLDIASDGTPLQLGRTYFAGDATRLVVT